ncbi:MULTISPECIES: LacI family DNA-binding transcriptional regulator [Microbacterium]|uniref:LacI family transcriptional regulator n=1 Tax=Microbacterium hominis TaxID=162426 RepID=A0A2K9DSP8_9MICO|nr:MULTISPECIES: LacI family DNA-binding transcriptional regulator [Microbacterium]AUG28854.1 LacI family transcriptional regulator [Microbacterium hominis]QOC24598.1 LacI family DNA-binding transcriptional regulator [Microbacterium hominis]QOC28662.1 LacI family DNA-binding transcriptional regulator [Microbacterium hominis]QYF99103.1 LacI family transcriptional regulator [Microbacterium sp. PAMC21962]
MAGIAEVAAHAGVSKATASRALSGAGYVSESTKSRVRAAAAELGYVPSAGAVGLATGRTQNVGVVMPYVNRWFFAEVLEGIQQALLERGLDLTLYDAKPGTDGRARIFDDFLARKRFDGLIAVGLEPVDHELERLTRIDRPIVSVVGSSELTSVVAVDDADAARRATEHLIALGHRDIAFVGGAPESHWAHVDQERLAGYRHAMREAGLSQFARHAHSEVTLPDGYAASADLLSDTRRRPTAIVGVCDEVAIGAIIAARRLGIQVPSALSVVGIDDHEFADMFALTTLQQVPREQGRAAVGVLLSEIAEPGRARTELRLPARLVVRSSTAPISDGVERV